MTRAVLSAAIDSEWRLVSHAHPCPVCGALDACSIHTEDAFVCCAREPSEWKLTNGAWLHRVVTSSVLGGRPANVDQSAVATNAARGDADHSGIRIRL
jgi:hypothetical protein